MEDMDMVILLAVILALVATLFIGKQQVVADGSIPVYLSSNNQVALTSTPTEAEVEAEIQAQHVKLLVYKQKKLSENLKTEAKFEHLEKDIRTLVGANINKIGIVYYDIKNNKLIEINGDNQFLAASTVKIPLNMLMYDMIQKGQIDINDKLKYTKKDFEEGAGVLQETKLNKPIAIKTLSDYSIRYSDNIAINMILRKVGNENRYNYIEEIVGHAITHKGNNTTPMDSFKLLERLYLNPDKNEYYSGIIENMKKTVFHDRIDKYIPNEIVAHKIGNYGEYVNDMAIVYKDNNPYILTIFTNKMPEAAEVIAQISKLIYDAQ